MNTEANNKRTQTEHASRTYWQTLEERTAPVTQWDLPEFETSLNEMREEAKKSGLSRKSFLKIMGAGAVMLSAACRRPTEEIVPAVIQPNEYVPGNPLFYATAAPDGSGIIVRVREGRPVKIAGNPTHPLTRGGVSAWTIASLMDLYDPDRIRRPYLFTDGLKQQTPEDELAVDVAGKLQEGPFVLITGPVTSPSTRALIKLFMNEHQGGRHIELVADPTLRQIAFAQNSSYGKALIPNYRFDRADYILSIDGDFLGTMIQPAMFSAQFASRRDLRHGSAEMNRLVAFESMYTVTGSMADERHPLRPGDQIVLALTIASEVILRGGKSALGGNATVKALLEDYKADKTAERLGIKAEDLRRIADELRAKSGKSIVIGGGPLAATDERASLQIAINLLNSALDNDGKTVDYDNPLQLVAGATDVELKNLFKDIKSGAIPTVLIADANPVYHLPASYGAEEALKKAYVISLGDRIDETSKLAAGILPSNHYLESWGDSELITGIMTLRQPVIRPLYNTRSLEDRLIQLAGGTLGGASTFADYVKNRWKGLAKGNFRKFWTSVLQAGFYSPGEGALKGTSGARNFNVGSIENIKVPAPSEGLKLGLCYTVQLLDGTGANNAYRQELPEPVTKVVWDNYVSLLPATARKLRIKEGSFVKVTTDSGTVELPAHLQPGLHPDALIIPLGFGRKAGGRVAAGIGVNGIELAVTGDMTTLFSGVKATVEVTGRRKKLSNMQSVYRNGYNTEDGAFFTPDMLKKSSYATPYDGSSTYGRPILLEASLEELKKDKEVFDKQKLEYPQNVGLMQPWDYSKNMRWHMVVDLNLCTGCAACVTSCNLENNIPMVGEEPCNYGREMHWLRIDRYYKGDESNPELAHQPMMCQQCGNAPCENVCPVNATQHNSEGLNIMAYNRCIGTRYCANNCPYKTRRFNFFEYWNYMEGLILKIHSPQHLGLNPDVTVRSRGVMEKCTFCIHRIAQARAEMRSGGNETLPDGTITTACQEVCPTRAISFGNIIDTKSLVSSLAKDKRGYRVLDFVGVDPSVTYLAKIRNKG